MQNNTRKFLKKLDSYIYWTVVSIIYFIISISTNNWGQSWLLLIIAGIVYSILEYGKNPLDLSNK